MGIVEQVPRRMTYTDLQQMPDDGRRYELYDGDVWVMPSPVLRHQMAVGNAYTLLRAYAEGTGGLAVSAPFDIVFSQYNVAEPDVVFFRAGRVQVLSLDGVAYERPDLAVEVLSPSTERNDRGRKLEMFARYRVPEYWILDPVTRTLEILSCRRGRYVAATTARGDDVVMSPLLPDLTFPVSRLFARC